MATDAEITLKFTAEIQEALKAIHQLRDEMEKIRAAGGVLSPEDAAMMEEMRGKLGDYTRQVRELQIEYYRLQQRGGEMSAEFIGRLTELRKELAETKAQLSPLLQKIVDLQVEVNHLKENTHQAGDELTRAGDGGQRAFRSLRGAVGNFIVNLAKGKLAVRELGLALKGLMYSTAILGAIQLAMEGIAWVADKVKAQFEDTSNAADAAKERLEEIEEAAKRAGDAADAAKEKLAKAAEQRDLIRAAEQMAQAYERQRDAVQGIVTAIKERATAEARERAFKARSEDFGYSMRELQLKTDLMNGKVTQGQYDRKMIALRGEQERTKAKRDVTEARAARDTANRALPGLELAMNKAEEDMNRQSKYVSTLTTPEEVELIKAKLEEWYTYREEAMERKNNGALGRANREIKELEDKLKGATSEQTYKNAVKNQELATKNFEKARAVFYKAIDDAKAANQNAIMVERDAAQATGQSRRRERAEMDYLTARETKARRDKVERQQQADKRTRETLQSKIDALARQGAAAVESPDKKDDRKFYEKLSAFLDKNGGNMAKVGANVDALIGLVEKLDIADNNQQKMLDDMQKRIDKLAREIKQTQGRYQKQSRF